MNPSSLRARVVIGTSVVVAALGTAFVASSASASTPPSEPPGSDAAAPAADADYDALTDAIVSTTAENGLPMNRDCVAGIVQQIPAEDVATILSEVEASAEVADMTMPEIEMPEISMPDLGDISIPEIVIPDISMPDLGDISIPELELPEFSIPDIQLPEITMPDITMPDLSIPMIPDIALSEETVALSRQLITCVEGDADPALVEQVVALAESSTPEGVLDLDCAAKMLSTFPDEVLQQIIDTGAVEADPTTADPAIVGEVTKLLACTDITSVTGSADAAVEAVPMTTAP